VRERNTRFGIYAWEAEPSIVVNADKRTFAVKDAVAKRRRTQGSQDRGKLSLTEGGVDKRRGIMLLTKGSGSGCEY
jgi:hypothetical protein